MRRFGAPRGVGLAVLSLVACDTATGPDRQVASVVVTSPGAPSLAPDATLQLFAQILNVAGSTVAGRTAEWSSLQPTVATVSATGLVTARAPGTAVVVAASDLIEGRMTITVAYAACSATTTSGTISVGQTLSGDFGRRDCAFSSDQLADGWTISVATSSFIRVELVSPTVATSS